MHDPQRLVCPRFPRASAYHPDWLAAGASSGANPLWLAEWLCESLELRPGMRVLDLGCGRAQSSIFLHREYGVQVWAADLWFDPTENLQRIRDAGAEHGVFPLRADARSLPFAAGFFDAIVGIDSFMYFATDDLFLASLARHLKPAGRLGIALAGRVREWDGPVPDALRGWWEPGMECLHSAAWWRRHWERAGILDLETADELPDGWRLWLDWQRVIAPHNTAEIDAIAADRGEHLGYVRIVGRLRADARIEAPIDRIPASYDPQPLRRAEA